MGSKIIKKSAKIGAFYGSTQYELDNFLCGIGESKILEDSINISDYPFEPSSVYPSKGIRPQHIKEIHLEEFPPTIKIGNELIFISREYIDELANFASRNKIQTVERESNWGSISNPFVDTEFSDDNKARTMERLKDNGFSESEITELRKEIGEQMFKYNFDTMLWDWSGLGVTDVLSAMRVRLNKKEFNKFYWRAMEIEQRKIED